MSLDLLQSIWFILVFVLFTGYAILDGFDLGVGILHLFTTDEHQRRISINSIGPVWDGNEVWLVAAGGALFAAFPPVYATVFSAFYIPLMLLLASLITRAVAIEFRSKIASPPWKRTWDFAFFLGSLLATLLLGVAFGNILLGIPIDPDGNYTGSFLPLLNPYALLVGLLTLVTFTMHGGIYLAAKSDAPLRDRLHRILPTLYLAFLILYLAASAAYMYSSIFLFMSLFTSPLFYLLIAIFICSAASLHFLIRAARFRLAFLASSLAIASMLALAANSLYPYLVPSLTNLNYSLSASNSSSSHRTLSVMLTIALIGLPLVILYSFLVHRVFKGKVLLSEESY